MKIANAIKKHFGTIVGQGDAKEKLADIIAGPIVEDGFMAPALLVAPVGFGKSELISSAKGLTRELRPDCKIIAFRDGAELGTPTSFMEDIAIKHMADKNALVIVDEVHKLSPSMKDLFRSMIHISAKRESVEVRVGKYSLMVNPHQHGFLFATNKVDLLDAAFMSRVERIDLRPYTDEEMATILFNAIEGQIIFNENTLLKIAACNRGSGRDIIKWVNGIKRHLALIGKKTVNKADVAAIIKKNQCYPMGVSANELNTLLILRKYGPQKLKELAAKNQCSSNEQDSNERYLLQRGLLEISTLRKITPAGDEYIDELQKDGFLG